MRLGLGGLSIAPAIAVAVSLWRALECVRAPAFAMKNKGETS
jgi:hypothetical protein